VPGDTHSPGRTIRLSAVTLSVVAVVVVALLMMQQRADAQLNFNQLVCSIILSIRSAFTGFLSFLNAVFTGLLQAFGCVISG